MAGEFGSKYGVRKGNKEDGVHEPDPDGGRYDLASEQGQVLERFLIKRDTQKGQNDIAEYLASSIFQQTTPGYGAEIELVKNTSPKPENSANKNAFLASRFFKQGYRDFFKENTSVFSKRTGALAALESTSLKSPKSAFKRKTKGDYEYSGYEKSIVTSLLLGDFSVHSGNIGVIDIEGGKGKKPKKQLVRIDFGAAFRDFTDDINPYQDIPNRRGVKFKAKNPGKTLPNGYQKNYFLRDHPKERTMNKAFSAELRRVADIDLTDLVAIKWAEIEKNFDPKTIQAFAKQIKVPAADLGVVSPEQIKAHFTETMQKRQQSLKDIACEIDIKLALKGKKVDIAKLQEAIVRNPKHVERILASPQNTQLRISLKESQLTMLREQFDHSIHRDIEKARSYFDNTIELMRQKHKDQIAKAQREHREPPPPIDFSQYKALQKQWHEVFDIAAKDLSKEFNIDSVYNQKILQSLAAITRPVNREFVASFLERPEYYQGRWAEVISANGQKLTGAIKEVVKASSMPIDYNKFDLTTATDSGGVTGSKRVKMDGENYQLKPSIKDNVFKRRAKANWTDRENYGEVISSKIARGILITDSFEAAPNVSLVYDKVRKRTPVASKYLEGDKVRTLDVFIQEKTGIKLEGKKHIKFVDGSKKERGANPEKREYDISGDENTALRKDIAKGIAGSIITGDHDINPGNFVVVTKDGQDRTARIDFGHAFNDLLNTSKAFGGTVRNKDNQVLDFLNRENLAGLKFGAQSKVWRDYPGMIPTQEMADAFKEVSQSTGLNRGVAEGAKEFTVLLDAMKRNGDDKGIAHLKKSLNAISSNITGQELDPKLTPEDTIKLAFDNIEKFSKDNQEKMASVGKLIQLQVNIDKIIEGKKEGVEPSKEQINQIKMAYAELEKSPGIGQKSGGLEWVKTDAKKAAHKGDLESYIMKRGKRLGLNKELRQELARTEGQAMTSSPLIKSRFGDSIALSDQLVSKEVEKPTVGLNESIQAQSPISTSKLQSSSIDPVALVRQEIIGKQTEILKQAVEVLHPEVSSLSSEQFKDYLKDHKNLVNEALENPVTKRDFEILMQQAEIAGYKKFNEEFAKVAKPVAWDGPAKVNEKSQIVRNSRGEEICTLKEQTVKLSHKVSTTQKEQEVSARTIDFPPKIKEGMGPMHASFALKDANGDNMPAKNAVYFTAHYDKTGNLMEVSTPQPVKFMGEGNKAVGYVERDGQIYTLPVTKETYQSMMQQVATNKGMGVDLLQKEEVERDQIITTAVEPPVKVKSEIIAPQESLKEAMSKARISVSLTEEDAVKEIDKILKGRKPQEVVQMLKHEISNGRDKIVDLVVQATSPNRVDRPLDSPKLDKSHYVDAYTYGMKKASPTAKTSLHQGNIHKASAKLIGHTDIPPKLHASTVKFNATQLNKKQMQGHLR